MSVNNRFLLKDPAASCGESFYPYGRRNICIRSLTPKQASGNALAVGFIGRMRSIGRLKGFILLLFAAIACVANAQDLIAVMDLKNDGTVQKRDVNRICNKISEEITMDKRYTVYDRKYLPVTLASMGIKKAISCSSVECLTDIGITPHTYKARAAS